MQKPKLAAQRLLEAHQRRQPFAPLPPELAPRSAEAAYAIQDSFVALRAERLGAIAGYKIALSSKAPPSSELHTIPTAWPASAWAVARSTMWRKIPPIGARTTWTILRRACAIRAPEKLPRRRGPAANGP